jgi:cysteine desulfurase
MRDQSTYLDFAATTPVDPRVLEAMHPYFNQMFGNPSSVHLYGQKAEDALEYSRGTVAKYLNCEPAEIIFTSCGSESDNLAIRGAALAERQRRGANQILTTPVEHHAITNTVRQLSDLYGFDVEYLPVDENGMVGPSELKSRLSSKTAVVSIILANNEIGTINPISEIGDICHQMKIPFHTDAVQAPAYLELDTKELNIDLLSLGAHKFYGPKGIGVLYIRKGIVIIPSLTGGGQESGLRAGTQNIPLIVGFAKAFELANVERINRVANLQPLRDLIIHNVLDKVPLSRLTGHPEERLPNHSSFVFNKVDGNTLTMMLDIEGFACSSGSACKTGNTEPSEVLTAIGISPEWALGSLRITLGNSTSKTQVETFLDILPEVVNRSRNLPYQNE